MKRKFSFNLAPVVSFESLPSRRVHLVLTSAEDRYQEREQADSRAHAVAHKVTVTVTLALALAPQRHVQG